MWRTSDILDVIFGDEETKKNPFGEETHQLSRKHGTSSGSVKLRKKTSSLKIVRNMD